MPRDMAQLFHPSFNTIARASILGGVFILAGLFAAGDRLYRSSYVTEEYVAREQPVPFSHEHHVAGLGIDCRYCHSTVEQANFAGMPSTKTCMTCHSQVWTNAEILKPVRDSFRDDRPLQWTRVHDLPDYVQFNHSIHVQKGIGCASCHGRVDEMPLMWKTNTLYMEWCLSCHRAPEKFVRPRDKVFDLAWTWESEGKDGSVEGPKLVEKYKIATWKYPVHNRATRNPHAAAGGHGATAGAHGAGGAPHGEPRDPHGITSEAGRDSHASVSSAEPAGRDNSSSFGVAKDHSKPEFAPNPLTNCSVCHY
jgi:hypothetical protein